MKLPRFFGGNRAPEVSRTALQQSAATLPPYAAAAAAPLRTRAEQILLELDLRTQVGAEIGPLDRPLVAKGSGTVYYVDYSDTDSVRARWASDKSINTAAIHVDAVWGSNTLREALAAAHAFELAPTGIDYVVASHVVEHVPDFVSWLREVRSVLSDGGTLRLAVPDRRYTFDYLRRTSTLTDVLDAYVRKRRTPSGSRVLDFALNMVQVDCGKAWRGELVASELVRGYSDESALGLAAAAETTDAYHDVHCWVFTPHSFAELMGQLARCKLLEFACDWLVPTARDTFEFYVSMRPGSDHDAVIRSWTGIAETLRNATHGPQS